jgi:hypothetical protein
MSISIVDELDVSNFCDGIIPSVLMGLGSLDVDEGTY